MLKFLEKWRYLLAVLLACTMELLVIDGTERIIPRELVIVFYYLLFAWTIGLEAVLIGRLMNKGHFTLRHGVILSFLFGVSIFLLELFVQLRLAEEGKILDESVTEWVIALWTTSVRICMLLTFLGVVKHIIRLIQGKDHPIQAAKTSWTRILHFVANTRRSVTRP